MKTIKNKSIYIPDWKARPDIKVEKDKTPSSEIVKTNTLAYEQNRKPFVDSCFYKTKRIAKRNIKREKAKWANVLRTYRPDPKVLQAKYESEYGPELAAYKANSNSYEYCEEVKLTQEEFAHLNKLLNE